MNRGQRRGGGRGGRGWGGLRELGEWGGEAGGEGWKADLGRG